MTARCGPCTTSPSSQLPSPGGKGAGEKNIPEALVAWPGPTVTWKLSPVPTSQTPSHLIRCVFCWNRPCGSVSTSPAAFPHPVPGFLSFPSPAEPAHLPSAHLPSARSCFLTPRVSVETVCSSSSPKWPPSAVPGPCVQDAGRSLTCQSFTEPACGELARPWRTQPHVGRHMCPPAQPGSVS